MALDRNKNGREERLEARDDGKLTSHLGEVARPNWDATRAWATSPLQQTIDERGDSE